VNLLKLLYQPLLMNKKDKKKKPIDNEMINFYDYDEINEFMPKTHNPNFDQHHLKLPFYMLICASSGSGKTVVLLNMIQRLSDTFTHIYICTEAREALYDLLQKKIPKGLTVVYKISDLPSMEELEKTKDTQKLICFDDKQFSKSEYIPTLFKRGRKLNVSTVFLAQSFFDTPKFIRKQIHYLILLNINGKRDLDSILRSYNFGDVSPEQLLEMFKMSTKDDFNFLKINTQEKNLNKKISHNFLEYFQIE